jgi:hypothetical protein
MGIGTVFNTSTSRQQAQPTQTAPQPMGGKGAGSVQQASPAATQPQSPYTQSFAQAPLTTGAGPGQDMMYAGGSPTFNEQTGAYAQPNFSPQPMGGKGVGVPPPQQGLMPPGVAQQQALTQVQLTQAQQQALTQAQQQAQQQMPNPRQMQRMQNLQNRLQQLPQYQQLRQFNSQFSQNNMPNQAQMDQMRQMEMALNNNPRFQRSNSQLQSLSSRFQPQPIPAQGLASLPASIPVNNELI